MAQDTDLLAKETVSSAKGTPSLNGVTATTDRAELLLDVNNNRRNSTDHAARRAEQIENSVTFGSDLQIRTPLTSVAVATSANRDQFIFELEDRRRKKDGKEFSPAVALLRGVVADSELPKLEEALKKIDSNRTGLDTKSGDLITISRILDTALNDRSALLSLSNSSLSGNEVPTRAQALAELQRRVTLFSANDPISMILLQSVIELKNGEADRAREAEQKKQREEAERQEQERIKAQQNLVEKRREDLLREVEIVARNLATRDSVENPGTSISAREVRQQLISIALKYPDLATDPKINAEVTSTFQSHYTEEFNSHIEKLPPGHQQFYSISRKFTGFFRDGIDELGEVISVELIKKEEERLRAEEQRRLEEEARKAEEARQEYERQQLEPLLNEVEEAARQMASSDFSNDPAGRPNQEEVQRRLQTIAEKYPHLASDPRIHVNISERVIGRFQNAYQSQFEHHFENDLNWFQKKYYGFCRWASDMWDQVVELGSLIKQKAVAAVEAVKEAAAATVEVISNVASSISSGIESAVDFVTDPQTWKSAWDGVCTVAAFVTDPGTWSAIGNGIVTGLTAAKNFITSPETWKAIGNGIVYGVSAIGVGLYTLATDPKAAFNAICTGAKAVWGFACDLSESLGINDLAYGLYKGAEGILRTAVIAPLQTAASVFSNGYKVLTGELRLAEAFDRICNDTGAAYGKALQCFAESGHAIKGAVTLFGEVTGITDVIMCAKYALEGNWTMAALHGGFALLSIGSIAATVATGGAAVGTIAAVAAGRVSFMQGLKQVGKVALKEMAKEGVEKLGKNVGKEVVGEIVSELGEKAVKEGAQKVSGEGLQTAIRESGDRVFQGMIERDARQIVDTMSSRLAREVSQNGREALSKDAVKAAAHDAAYEATQKLLKELGVFDKVHARVLDLLHDINGKGMVDSLRGASLGRITRTLESSGVASTEAREMAVALRKALRKGRSDDEMAEILTRTITDEISGEIQNRMEHEFKSRFASALRGTLDSGPGRELAQAMSEKGIKLSDSQIDELVEAGWDGCKQGIRKATHEVVEKAVRKAFDDFRKRNYDVSHPSENNPVEFDRNKKLVETFKTQELARRERRSKKVASRSGIRIDTDDPTMSESDRLRARESEAEVAEG